MSILLDVKEIEVCNRPWWLDREGDYFDNYDPVQLVKITGKKIALKLQAIYNLPDEGMFHKKLGEFIEKLMEEVQ